MLEKSISCEALVLNTVSGNIKLKIARNNLFRDFRTLAGTLVFKADCGPTPHKVKTGKSQYQPSMADTSKKLKRLTQFPGSVPNKRSNEQLEQPISKLQKIGPVTQQSQKNRFPVVSHANKFPHAKGQARSTGKREGNPWDFYQAFCQITHAGPGTAAYNKKSPSEVVVIQEVTLEHSANMQDLVREHHPSLLNMLELYKFKEQVFAVIECPLVSLKQIIASPLEFGEPHVSAVCSQVS